MQEKTKPLLLKIVVIFLISLFPQLTSFAADPLPGFDASGNPIALPAPIPRPADIPQIGVSPEGYPIYGPPGSGYIPPSVIPPITGSPDLNRPSYIPQIGVSPEGYPIYGPPIYPGIPPVLNLPQVGVTPEGMPIYGTSPGGGLIPGGVPVVPTCMAIGCSPVIPPGYVPPDIGLYNPPVYRLPNGTLFPAPPGRDANGNPVAIPVPIGATLVTPGGYTGGNPAGYVPPVAAVYIPPVYQLPDGSSFSVPPIYDANGKPVPPVLPEGAVLLTPAAYTQGTPGRAPGTGGYVPPTWRMPDGSVITPPPAYDLNGNPIAVPPPAGAVLIAAATAIVPGDYLPPVYKFADGRIVALPPAYDVNGNMVAVPVPAGAELIKAGGYAGSLYDSRPMYTYKFADGSTFKAAAAYDVNGVLAAVPAPPGATLLLDTPVTYTNESTSVYDRAGNVVLTTPLPPTRDPSGNIINIVNLGPGYVYDAFGKAYGSNTGVPAFALDMATGIDIPVRISNPMIPQSYASQTVSNLIPVVATTVKSELQTGSWASVDATGKVVNVTVCSQSICGAKGEWKGVDKSSPGCEKSCKLVLQIPPDPITGKSVGGYVSGGNNLVTYKNGEFKVKSTQIGINPQTLVAETTIEVNQSIRNGVLTEASGRKIDLSTGSIVPAKINSAVMRKTVDTQIQAAQISIAKTGGATKLEIAGNLVAIDTNLTIRATKAGAGAKTFKLSVNKDSEIIIPTNIDLADYTIEIKRGSKVLKKLTP